MGKLSHLNVSTAPKRSTLSYVNQHKPSSLFRALFFKAMGTLPCPWPRAGKRASSNSRKSS
ncbi:hypothetical protein DFAR_2510006 [Desulfarculales bacterium]